MMERDAMTAARRRRNRIALSAVLAAAVLAPALVVLSRVAALGRVPDTFARRAPRAPRLVFIDAGGNTGQTVEWFTQGAKDIFQSPHHNSSSDPRDYEIFVFEPNKVFLPHYENLRKKGLNFTLIQAAVADADGFAHFSGFGEGGLIFAGGVSKEPPSASAVRAIDFSRWLMTSFDAHDTLICKIDIEGAETSVVSQMMRDGSVCRCNRISVEWHSWIGTESTVHRASFNSKGAMQAASELLEGRSSHSAESLYCSIPHARRRLPYSDCLLPLVFSSVRRGCANGAAPLEKWF